MHELVGNVGCELNHQSEIILHGDIFIADNVVMKNQRSYAEWFSSEITRANFILNVDWHAALVTMTRRPPDHTI